MSQRLPVVLFLFFTVLCWTVDGQSPESTNLKLTVRPRIKNEGDVIVALCGPKENEEEFFLWFIGNKQITEGRESLLLHDQLTGELKTYVRLTRNVTWRDAGKELSCVKRNGYQATALGDRREVLHVQWDPYFPAVRMHINPSAPQYDEGTVVEVTCGTKSYKWEQNFRWFIGNRELTMGINRVILMPDENGQRVFQQVLSHNLTSTDNGEEIRCERTLHEGSTANEEKQRLQVRFGPKQQSTYHYKNLIVGGYGYISLDIEANPKPKVTWHIGSRILAGGVKTGDGRYNAHPVLNVRKDTWRVGLLIQDISHEDASRIYYLDAENSVNTKRFVVTKSIEDVANTHRAPKLDLVRGSSDILYHYKEGELLQATCVIRGEYSVPPLQWYLGSKHISERVQDRVLSWDGGLKQVTLNETLVYRAKWSDNRVFMRCTSGLGFQIVFDWKMLNITYVPRNNATDPMHLGGFVLGETGYISVMVQGNPTPSLRWRVGSEVVSESGDLEQDESPYSFQVLSTSNPAAPSSHTETLNTVLKIKTLTEENLETPYYLEATNSAGKRQFNISIHRTYGRAPTLTLSEIRRVGSRYVYRAGETVNVDCEVKGVRSVPKLSWRIGDQEITEGVNFTLVKNDNYVNMTVRSTLSHQVSWMDNGRSIKCIVGRTDTVGNKTIPSRTLSVIHAPRIISTALSHEGFIVGKVGNITLIIQANPRPNFTWTVGNSSLAEFGNRLKARNEKQLETNCQWKVFLLFEPVVNEDINREVYLMINNVEGTVFYNTTLSAIHSGAEQHPGSELTIGIIVGLLVVILILLLISAIIFARKSQRWCFKAATVGPEEETKSVEDVTALYATVQKVKKKSPKPPVKSSDSSTEVCYENLRMDNQTAPGTNTNDGEVASASGNGASSDRKPDIVYAELALQTKHQSTVKRKEEPTLYAQIVRR